MPGLVRISGRPVLRAFALAALAGCGLDLGGDEFVASVAGPHSDGSPSPGIVATDASSAAAPDAGIQDAEAAFVLDTSLIRQGLPVRDAGSPALDASPADAASSETLGVLDAATDDGAGDGGSACDRLARCCTGLVAAPPALLLCISGSQLVDGGDAKSCASLVATLLCP